VREGLSKALLWLQVQSFAFDPLRNAPHWSNRFESPLCGGTRLMEPLSKIATKELAVREGFEPSIPFWGMAL
jgi:hypothetical protein